MNQSGSFPELWASALKLYQKRTGRDLQSDPHAVGIQSLDDLRNKIDKSNTDFTGFREKHERLWKVISAVCAPIQVMGGLARDVAGATQIVPACAAFGAIFYLITAAKGVSEAYDDVEGLLARIAAATKRFEVYDQGKINRDLGMLVAETICKILEILGRAEKLARRSRPHEYFRVAVLGKDEKLKGLLDDLERLSSEEARLVLALGHSSNQRIEKAVDKLQVQISQSHAEISTESERRDMAATLDGGLSDRMYKIYKSIGRDRTRSTSDWIFDDPIMQAWLEKSSTFLWILGVGGIGKSFLSARIINEIEKHKYAAGSVAYCYIKSDVQSSGSINSILRCIAFQLAMQNNEYRSFATIVCKDHNRLRVSEDTWEHLFEAYFQNDHFHGDARVVIDGIDETSPEQQSVLFKLMQELYRKPPRHRCRLQFLLLGRPEIVAQWPETPPAYIEVTPIKMSKDVRRYIKENIMRIKLLDNHAISKNERKALKHSIVERLQQGASGMFLWVKLMLDEIMFQPRPSDIKRILASPPNLLQLLDNILERIVSGPSGSGSDLKEILLWTSFAPRELYLGELKLILELKEPVGEGLPGLETYLREEYRSLFVLDRKDGKTTEDLRRMAALSHKASIAPVINVSTDEDSDDDSDDESDYQSDGESADEESNQGQPFKSDLWTTKIRIGHSIIREYITDGHSKRNKAINIDPNQAHTHIAMMCMRSLSDCLPMQNGQPLPDQARFQQYAASNFLFHTIQLDPQKMGQDDIDAIASRLTCTMHDPRSLSRIIQLRDDDDSFLATYFSDEILLKLQQWIALAPPHLGSPAEIQWRSSAQSSKISLLNPMADTIAMSWLQEMPLHGQVGRKYVNFNIAFLHAYQCIEIAQSEAGKPGAELVSKSPSIYDVDELHYKQICHVAINTNLPQNSLWYSTLGLALSWNNHDHEAVPFFEKAIELDQKNPISYHGLCNAYCNLGNYAQSIKMGIARLDLEATESPLTFGTWFWMERSAARLGSSEIATLIWAQEHLGAHARSTSGTLFIMQSLRAQRRHADVMKLLEDLLADSESTITHSRLYKLLPHLSREVFMIAMAAVFARKVDRAIVIAKSLAEAAEKANNFREVQISRYLHGLICFISRQDYSTSMEIFESIRSNLDHYESETHDLPAIRSIGRYLSYLYFEKCMEAKKLGESTAATWIAKMEDLIKKPSSISPGAVDAQRVGADDSVTATLALWYRLEGDSKACERLLEARFRKGIQILQDKNVHNDAQGYDTLSKVLFRGGNCDQAIAALTPLLLPFSREQERIRQYEQDHGLPSITITDQVGQHRGSREEAVAESDVLGENPSRSYKDQLNKPQTEMDPPIIAEASGFDLTQFMSQESSRPGLPLITGIDDNVNYFVCGCRSRIIDEMWVCEYCEPFEVRCGECLPKFKKGELRFFGPRHCQSYHPYHQVYPMREEMRYRATETVQGRTLPRKEWLAELEANWMPKKEAGTYQKAS